MLSCPGSSSGDKCRLIIRSNAGNGAERRTSNTTSEMSRGTPFPRGLNRAEGVTIQSDSLHVLRPRHGSLSHGSGQCRNSAQLTLAAVPGHSGGSEAGFSQRWRRGAPAACAQSPCNNHHSLLTQVMGLPSTPGPLRRGEQQHSVPSGEQGPRPLSSVSPSGVPKVLVGKNLTQISELQEF